MDYNDFMFSAGTSPNAAYHVPETRRDLRCFERVSNVVRARVVACVCACAGLKSATAGTAVGSLQTEPKVPSSQSHTEDMSLKHEESMSLTI
ncbi:unnamed protein product, partial [Brenthis ino]